LDFRSLPGKPLPLKHLLHGQHHRLLHSFKTLLFHLNIPLLPHCLSRILCQSALLIKRKI
jgi:hypothetical protein